MNREDYSFIPYDKRYSYSDLILPAFGPEESGAIRNIWFCVDTSGSITKEELTALVGEIRQAFFQFRNFKGKLSYFDYTVTEPAEFESVVDLEKCTPVGGGGTSFRAIFWYMQEHTKDDLPEAVVIMTDGCAPFPNESCAMGVPVLWVIINSDVQPPWGEVIYIEE